MILKCACHSMFNLRNNSGLSGAASSWGRAGVCDAFRRRIGRGHKHSFTHLLDSFHDDALAEPETLLNDPEVSTSFADTHGLDNDLVVSLNDGDLIAALQFHHRALRHEQGALRQVEPHAHSREPAWAESIVRVWELRFNPEGSRSQANLPIGGVDVSRMGINRAVGQDQFDFQLPEPLITVALG